MKTMCLTLCSVLLLVALSTSADVSPLMGAAERARLAEEFWKRTDLKVGVAVATPPVLRPHTRITDAYGSQLRGFDNDMPAAVEPKLAALGKGDGESELDLIAKMIVGRLGLRGLQATAIADRITVRSLPRFKPPSRGHWAREDFRVYKNQYSIDMLVLLEIQEWGTVRHAANFESSLYASGFMNAKLRIIRLEDNMLVGSIIVPWESQVNGIGYSWNVPPAYTDLLEGMLVSIRRSAQNLMRALTSTAPLGP